MSGTTQQPSASKKTRVAKASATAGSTAPDKPALSPVLTKQDASALASLREKRAGKAPDKTKPEVKSAALGKDIAQVPELMPDAGQSRYRSLLSELHTRVLDRIGAGHERVPTGDPSSRAPSEAPYYARSTPRRVANWALDLVPEGPKGFNFVDLGSGRGRVVLEASRRPYSSITGVEIDNDMHAAAELNLRHWPRSEMQCREVQLVKSDALRWMPPEGDLIVYMFDPFDTRKLTTIASRLARHAALKKARIYVVYVNPVSALPFEESPYFEALTLKASDTRKLGLLSPYEVSIFKAQTARK